MMRGLLVFLFVVCLLVPITTAQLEQCLQLTSSPTLEKFVDPLPVIERINLTATSPSSPLVLGAFKIQQKLHRDLPETTLYAFGTSASQATYPGPTLIASKEAPAYVRWENNITDLNHTLMVDPTISRAEPSVGVPLVVHLHGMGSEGSSDGHPDAWFTNGGETGPNYTTQNYVYPNAQPATLLWYHDHSFGYTRLSVAAGLAGFYVLVSPKDEPKWIPRHVRERGKQNDFIHHMLVQDKQFYDNGTIKYPQVGVNPPAHPNWCVDYFGDVMLVNGKVWPYLNVSRAIHRFRVLNGGNSRFLIFNLSNPSLTFIKIGTDGGFLSTAVAQAQLRLAPAERVDFLIDFSNMTDGDNVTMTNVAPAPFPSGPMNNQSAVMMFKVVNGGASNGTLPTTLLAANLTIEETILQTVGFNLSTIDLNSTRRRQFVIGFNTDSAGGLRTLFSDGTKTFRDPPTEIIELFTDEVWEFINTVPGVAHPMHLHLINFFVLNQQAYNNSLFMANNCSFNTSFPDPTSCFTEAPQPPDNDQLGWKDTAVVQPFVVTRFLVQFRPRDRDSFMVDPTRAPGYVWHCHLLEHEDNEMMRPLLFTNSTSST